MSELLIKASFERKSVIMMLSCWILLPVMCQKHSPLHDLTRQLSLSLSLDHTKKKYVLIDLASVYVLGKIGRIANPAQLECLRYIFQLYFLP